MIILDIIALIFIVLITYGGYRRGVLLEVFDIVIIFLDLGVTSYLCPYLAKFFKIFIRWPDKTGLIISFTIIFLALGVIFYLIALTIDRAAKLDVLIKNVNSYAGSIVAFIKSWVLLWIVILMVLLLPLKKETREQMHNSFMVKVLKGRTSVMMSLFEVVIPSGAYKEVKKIVKENKYL